MRVLGLDFTSLREFNNCGTPLLCATCHLRGSGQRADHTVQRFRVRVTLGSAHHASIRFDTIMLALLVPYGRKQCRVAESDDALETMVHALYTESNHCGCNVVASRRRERHCGGS